MLSGMRACSGYSGPPIPVCTQSARKRVGQAIEPRQNALISTAAAHNNWLWSSPLAPILTFIIYTDFMTLWPFGFDAGLQQEYTSHE